MVAVPAPLVIVAPGMRALAVALWVLAVVLVPIGVLSGGVRAVPFVVLPSVFTAWFAWVVLWRPRIVATPEELVVVDVRRTTRFTWTRVLEIRSKYGVEIVSSEGERRTWVAPRPTARLSVSGTALPGGASRVDAAGAAALLVAFVPSREVSDAPPPASVVAAPITHRIHGWLVLSLIVLGIAASMSAARI
jgi:hypothetical protein